MTMRKQPEDKNPGEGRLEEAEHFLAPPPPSKGKIIGVDCHPDSFTAAVLEGQTPHEARQLCCRADMTLEELLEWAQRECSAQDLFLLEAGSNSFEVHGHLLALGRRAVVLESAHVGKHAKSYADNDKSAAARIARVYLAGNAPCVWVPDAETRQRRELLHAYGKAVEDCTAATNSLKSYLNQFTVRLGQRKCTVKKTQRWILAQREWSELQLRLLEDHFANCEFHAERRKELCRLISREVAKDRLMLGCMKLLGIGVINAFALVAIIGDVRRFEHAGKLVAYVGLNPGQRESGRGKRVKLGVGNRGRGDLRRYLIQGAQAVLRYGRGSKLSAWGWKLFARKGSRNVAVAAVARKLLVQVWYLLSGKAPEAVDSENQLRTKLGKLTVNLGKSLRREMELPATIAGCIQHFRDQLNPIQKTTTA